MAMATEGGKGWEEVNDGEEPRSDEQSLSSLASAGLCIWWGAGGSVVWTDRQRGRKGKKTTVSASYCISMCFCVPRRRRAGSLGFFF